VECDSGKAWKKSAEALIVMVLTFKNGSDLRDMKYFGKASPLSVPRTVFHSQYFWSAIYNFFKTARVDGHKKFIFEPNYSLAPGI
jgi:hypothetical protein